MIRKSSLLVRSLAIIAMLAGAGTLSATPAHADNGYGEKKIFGVTLFEAAHCLSNAIVCNHAADAQRWAFSITAWKFPGDPANGNAADAFRHCSWAGTLTHRVGYDEAMQVLKNHEDIDSRQGREAYKMDMANNRKGAEIGKASLSRGGSDQWGWILERCEKQARSGALKTVK